MYHQLSRATGRLVAATNLQSPLFPVVSIFEDVYGGSDSNVVIGRYFAIGTNCPATSGTPHHPVHHRATVDCHWGICVPCSRQEETHPWHEHSLPPALGDDPQAPGIVPSTYSLLSFQITRQTWKSYSSYFNWCLHFFINSLVIRHEFGLLHKT